MGQPSPRAGLLALTAILILRQVGSAEARVAQHRSGRGLASNRHTLGLHTTQQSYRVRAPVRCEWDCASLTSIAYSPREQSWSKGGAVGAASVVGGVALGALGAASPVTTAALVALPLPGGGA